MSHLRQLLKRHIQNATSSVDACLITASVKTLTLHVVAKLLPRNKFLAEVFQTFAAVCEWTRTIPSSDHCVSSSIACRC